MEFLIAHPLRKRCEMTSEKGPLVACCAHQIIPPYKGGI